MPSPLLKTPASPLVPHPTGRAAQRARRWGPMALTVVAAAVVIGGLVRLATDDRVVDVVSFRDAEVDPAELVGSLQARR